jgi:hypothetical protein
MVCRPLALVDSGRVGWSIWPLSGDSLETGRRNDRDSTPPGTGRQSWGVVFSPTAWGVGFIGGTTGASNSMS